MRAGAHLRAPDAGPAAATTVLRARPRGERTLDSPPPKHTPNLKLHRERLLWKQLVANPRLHSPRNREEPASRPRPPHPGTVTQSGGNGKHWESPWGAQGLDPTGGTPAFRACPWKTDESPEHQTLTTNRAPVPRPTRLIKWTGKGLSRPRRVDLPARAPLGGSRPRGCRSHGNEEAPLLTWRHLPRTERQAACWTRIRDLGLWILPRPPPAGGQGCTLGPRGPRAGAFHPGSPTRRP